jgi:hypothetical protein
MYESGREEEILQAIRDVRLFLQWATNIAHCGVRPCVELLTDCIVILREALESC